MSNGKKLSTTETAQELIMPILDDLGIDLWDVLFEKEGAQWYLRYLIDKEEGLTIEDCEVVSRAISEKLDQTDPIPQSYILEVGSPGIERELKKEEHFVAYLGELISIRFIRPVEGVRDFVGTLVSKEGPDITVELEDGREMTFSLKETAHVRVYFDFESGGSKE